jgi:translation initiation factor 2B subunit (eIF-2B alpha/beta/delta family)
MRKQLPEPDQEMIYEVMSILKNYRADGVIRFLIRTAGSLMATSEDPEAMLAEMQGHLADDMHKLIEILREARDLLNKAKAEFKSTLHANKGLRRRQ